MRKWLDRLYGVSGAMAAISLAGIGVLMLVQVAGREVGLQLRGADDMAAWLCAASAFLGLGHTFRNGDMVRVGLWLGMLKGRTRWLAEVSALGITTVFLGYAAWAVSGFVFESWRMNEVNQGLLQVPMWIPQMSLVLGIVILLVAVLDEFSRVLRGKKPAYQIAEDARSARGDFSEAV